MGLQSPRRGHTRLKTGPQIQAMVPCQSNILWPSGSDTWARGLRWAPRNPVSILGNSWKSMGQPSQSQEVKGRGPRLGEPAVSWGLQGTSACPWAQYSSEHSQEHKTWKVCDMWLVSLMSAWCHRQRGTSLCLTLAKGFC